MYTILLLCCMCVSTHSIIIHSISTDKEALLSLKPRFFFQSPNLLSSWDAASSSPCNWTGVSCTENRERVIGLDLSGLRLSGSISPHVGNLTSLKSLHLENNQLTGIIPAQIGNLVNLRDLNMRMNAIEGALPRNLSRCKQLIILDLRQNEISGEISGEIGLMTKLQVLRLATNHLSGPIPSTISNISSLYELNLATNSLTGPIPSSITRLPHLSDLNLIINNLTGIVPPSLYNMSSLVHLSLAANKLWGDLPYNMGETLPNLQVVNFFFNKFTGTIPGSLHNLTNIRTIRVAHNFLHGDVPPGLGNLPELQMYYIGYNKLVHSSQNSLDFLSSLSNSTKLTFLSIDHNHMKGQIPETIGNLSKVLKILYMGGNFFHGTIPRSIGNLKSLALLDLGLGSLSGEIPEEIGQLKDLQILALQGNHLSGQPPDSLGNLRNLIKIDLSGNKLVGNIPATFKNFQKLQSMDLSKNRLNGSLPVEIRRLQSLSDFLKLSNNDLTGPLPKEIGLLKSVEMIYISFNRLSGNIPETVGDCKSLQRFILANNMLSGRLPDALGEMNGLETLDLSSNEFCGEIPVSLSKLQALDHLNLSFNNLEGEVPAFPDSQAVELQGNPKLLLNLTYNRNTPNRSRKWLIIGLRIAGMVTFLIVSGLILQPYMRTRNLRNKKAEGKSFRQEHQMITFHELRLATNNFSHQNVIGKGGFGSVYSGMLADETAVAVKIIDTGMAGSWKSFLAECAALKVVRHRNILKLITACSSLDFRNNEFLGLVYEFRSNGSLEDWLRGRKTANGKGLTVLDQLDVMIDVASALCYLHHECETPIVHCDIKAGNVLLDSDMTAKVGDFGISKSLIERIGNEASISSAHALKGSIGYIPPEYGLGQKPSTAGDVYSYGIMLLEVFTGKSPTDESLEGLGSLKKWVQMGFPSDINRVLDYALLLRFPENNSMVHSCLVSIISIGLNSVADSPDKRISMKDALNSLKNIKNTLLKPMVN